MKEKLNLLYANLAKAILIKTKIVQDCTRVETGLGVELGKGECNVLGCLWEKVFQFKWSVGIEPRNN